MKNLIADNQLMKLFESIFGERKKLPPAVFRHKKSWCQNTRIAVTANTNDSSSSEFLGECTRTTNKKKSS